MAQVNPPPVRKREIFGWAMYDFANSSYTTVVVSFIYSAFFIAYIVPPELDQFRNSFWSVAVAVSTALAIFLAPLIGVVCDYTARKKQFLAICTLLSVSSTGALFFVNPGDLWLGLFFLIVSNTAWMLSESFIASFLPEISTPKNIGKISGFGWGIGYAGGLISLLIVLAIITTSASENLNGYVFQVKLAMVAIALFYGFGASLTLILLKERAVTNQEYEHLSLRELLRAAITRLADMKAIVGDYPVLFRFLLSFMVFSAGISIVVKFFGIYAQEEVGISGGQLIAAGAILQISSMLGAIGFGFLEDKVGAKPTLLFSLLWWVLGIVGIYFLANLSNLFGLEEALVFIGLAFVAGTAMGATQSTSRAIVGLMANPKDSAMLFGLWGTFARFGIILGMLFGPVSDVFGRHDALLFILVYFIAGGLMLMTVPISRGYYRPQANVVKT